MFSDLGVLDTVTPVGHGHHSESVEKRASTDGVHMGIIISWMYDYLSQHAKSRFILV